MLFVPEGLLKMENARALARALARLRNSLGAGRKQ